MGQTEPHSRGYPRLQSRIRLIALAARGRLTKSSRMLAALDAEVRESQRRRRLVDQALSKGEVRAWDFQPFRDASRQYMRNSMDLDDLEAMARFPRVKGP